jgi:aminoglycoside 6'-N-acetyltransferase I
VTVRIVLLGEADEHVLASVASEVFDHPVRADRAREFLCDPRHHLAVALDGDTVVAMASAVHYIHPDKDPELWINEVGVAGTHQRQGIATRLLDALFEAAVRAGCREAWVLTEGDNDAARSLYESAGGVETPEDSVLYTFRLGSG